MIETPILIATGNAGKAREFLEILAAAQPGRAALRFTNLADHSNVVEVQETGTTVDENACLKATGYARQFNRWALADDSGLEVDALGGSPGVYSARWAEMHDAGKGDAANNAQLLEQLRDVPDAARTARFVCVLALSDPAGQVVLTARDSVEGQILRSPRGTNGFGYDPLFLVAGTALTTAELPRAEKHRVSHRGKALRRLAALMSQAGLA